MVVGVQLTHFVGLRTFLSLDDLEFNVVAFLQSLVAIRCDCTIVNEDISSIVPTDETESLSVVEPLDLTFQRQFFLRACPEETGASTGRFQFLNPGSESYSSWRERLERPLRAALVPGNLLE
jgi:hypothetical protein